MSTLLQDEIEYSIKRVEYFKENKFSVAERDERQTRALLLIADDLHAIRGLIESLVLALGDRHGY